MQLAENAHLLTVEEVEARLTERGLARWIAFYKIKAEEREREQRATAAKVKR